MDGTNLSTPRAVTGGWSPTWTAPSFGALTQGLRAETGRLRLMLANRIRWSEPTTLALAAVLSLSLYFALLPGVDIAISDLFYRTGDGFFLAQEPVLKALRRSSSYVMGLILLAALAGVAMRVLTRSEKRTVCARRCGFLLAGLALGPGLVVNSWLKGSWGRARPVQTDLFGGDAVFSPAWRVANGCEHNCSFVSGEASSAAWMVAALMLLPPRWRPWAAAPLITYAVALSLNRLAFGGHYLSDILLSWAITALVLAVLHRVMVACPIATRLRHAPGLATHSC